MRDWYVRNDFYVYFCEAVRLVHVMISFSNNKETTVSSGLGDF